MKYEITKMGLGKCRIKLVPENDIENKLLILNSDKEKEEKMYTFEYHYQQAIKYKYGTKAHLNSISEILFPVIVDAEYILEGGSLGGH